MTTNQNKCIWIDLDNSPHVPLFKPIIAELKKRGYKTMVTARDCFQVCSLADLHHIEYKKIGYHHGKNKIRKVFGLFYRALQLMPIVLSEKPVLALSHGSRSQVIISNILRIPSVIMDDYEPSKGLPLFGPDWLIMPEVISNENVRFSTKFLRKYSGIKEDIYVPDFKPDDSILRELNIGENEIVVVVRPPATEAHYHNPESEVLYNAVIELLSETDNVRIILVPRTDKQASSAKIMWPNLFEKGKIMIPPKVVNGLNLIWHADLVISGGGTMNREATALGVPVYSIFRGTIGAVDRYLSENGRLVLLETVEDVKTKIQPLKRHREQKANFVKSAAMQQVVAIIEEIMEKC